MSGGESLEQLSQQLQALEQQRESMEGQLELLRDQKSAIDEAVEAIDSLDTGSTVQVPLGGGAYVRAEIDDIDEIIVELGGGYAAEQTEGDAVETLQSRKETVDERIDDLRDEIAEVDSEMEQLSQRARSLQQQQMQQMQQGMQGMGGLGDEDE